MSSNPIDPDATVQKIHEVKIEQTKVTVDPEYQKKLLQRQQEIKELTEKRKR